MQAVLNHLVQLQELILIRDEQKLALGRPPIEELEQNIRDMVAKLPPNVRALYQRLCDRDHTVVAPIAHDVCAACGMQLPISLIQAVRLAREIHSCPQCVRILFYSDKAPRRLGLAARRTEPRKVGIARFSAETLMIPDLGEADAEASIRALAGAMQQGGFIDNAEKLVAAAWRREAILSTAVDNGLAFPHARGVEGGGLALALGMSRKGIHFDHGKSLTRIVFFLAIPTAASAFYLKLLSGLSSTFVDAEARKALLAEKDPASLWKTLCRLTRATVK